MGLKNFEKLFFKFRLISPKVNKTEIEALITIYKGITKNQDRMDRLKFRDVLHNSFAMTDDMIMDRGIYFYLAILNNEWKKKRLF